MLKVDIERVSYEECGPEIIRRARLNVETGNIVCISGKNGAGKTTFLNCLCGTIPKIVRAYGSVKISTDNNKDFMKEMIYVSQYTENSLFFFDVKSQLIHLGYDKMKCVLKKFGLEDKINSKVRTLSAGQKKIISIIGALYTKKKICIFDEPTTFLDDQIIDKLFCEMRNVSQSKIIILVSHDCKCMNFVDCNYEMINNELIKIDRPVFFPVRIKSHFEKKDIWLELDGISFTYPNGNNVMINQRIIMCKNEILGIVGKNGCGKTTIMNYFFEKNNREILTRGMLQDFRKQFFSYTVQGEVELILGKKSKENVSKFLQRIGLYEVRNENPNFISDGQKRLLLIGVLMLSSGEILFLDEPFDNLDNNNRQIAIDLIQDFREHYQTIVLMDQSVSNISDVVERVIYINN